VRAALLSVTDKTGVVELARGLVERDVRVLSTGGTARVLREAGVPVTDVSEVTGFPEIMDGRVKTLHPRVHGGLLARRDRAGHREALAEHGIGTIDVVAVNLYAFEETVARPDVDPQAAIEAIDIGGPSMLRSAAKNHEFVWVATDPSQYGTVLAGLDGDERAPEALAARRRLALQAFATTAAYDAAISAWFERRFGERDSLAPRRVLALRDGRTLRYGENPSQRSVFHADAGVREACVATAEQLGGKALSYNNIMDADAALELVKEFDAPAAAVVKHANPCGAGTGATLEEAFTRAWSGDPRSAFGGILAFNRPVTEVLARSVARPDHFLEIVVAPSFDEDAAETLRTGAKWGRNVRLLACGPLGGDDGARRDERELAVRKVTGGWLVQDRDLGFSSEERRVVSARAPGEREWADLEFAWRVCKHVKSNAILLAREGAVVGVGAGQMSRVDAVFMAGHKAGGRASGSVLASDAFFPFRDSIDEAARLGVTAVIQPGGSIRDEESVAAADEHGLALVVTGARHFRH